MGRDYCRSTWVYRGIDRHELYEFKEVFTGSIILILTH